MKQRAWNSYVQFHQLSEYGQFPQEHRRSAGRIPFEMLSVESQPHNFADPGLGETLIALPLEVEKDCRWTWKMDDRTVTQRVSVGRMLVIPPGVDSFWEVNGSRTLLTLCIPNASFRSILGDICPTRIGEALWNLSADTWEDEFVEGAIKQLWRCCAGDQLLDGYLSDGIIAAIVANLLKRAGSSAYTNNPVAMPAWRMRKVQSYVEDHLAENISVVDLAQAAGISARHFFRAFRSQTGETPHRWLAAIRLEKAKRLLTDSNERLYDIAQMCGFSNQSHLSSVFRQMTGVTPSQWRSSRKTESVKSAEMC